MEPNTNWLTGYKLFRKRRDGTYGPLFINRRLRLLAGVAYDAESHFTKGYAYRPGWHICREPRAPHLTMKGRVWCKVEFTLKETLIRPESQGGIWYLGHRLRIVEELGNETESADRAA
jgi:hypothetical protein